ncbi:hypothetical protein [Rhodococcus olei]
MHTDTVDADLDRLSELTTGRFAGELSDSGSGVVQAIRDAAVNADGRVDSAALASESGGGGVVLVAASGAVTNAAGPTATPRNYRLRVTVDDVDGRLLMSNVEFVP